MDREAIIECFCEPRSLVWHTLLQINLLNYKNVSHILKATRVMGYNYYVIINALNKMAFMNNRLLYFVMGLVPFTCIPGLFASQMASVLEGEVINEPINILNRKTGVPKKYTIKHNIWDARFGRWIMSADAVTKFAFLEEFTKQNPDKTKKELQDKVLQLVGIQHEMRLLDADGDEIVRLAYTCGFSDSHDGTKIPEGCHVHDIYTHENFRKMGFARILLLKAFEGIEKEGHPLVLFEASKDAMDAHLFDTFPPNKNWHTKYDASKRRPRYSAGTVYLSNKSTQQAEPALSQSSVVEDAPVVKTPAKKEEIPYTWGEISGVFR